MSTSAQVSPETAEFVGEILKIVLGVVLGSAGTLLVERFRRTDAQISEKESLKDIQALKYTAGYSQADDEDPDIPWNGIAIDRFDAYQQRRASQACPLAFVDIRIDETTCAWKGIEAAAPPLGYPEEAFHDWQRAKLLYESAVLAFEQQFPDRRSQTLVDPIFDVIVRNQSDSSVLVTGLSITTIAAWSVPKGARIPVPVISTRMFDIEMHPESQFSYINFQEPKGVDIEADGLWSFQLRLKDFSSRWNEILIAISLRTGMQKECESEPIYLGPIT